MSGPTETKSTEVGSLTEQHRDTLRVKEAAMRLLAYEESETIYRQLSNRIERMVRTELDLYNGITSNAATRAAKKHGVNEGLRGGNGPSIYACAVRLNDFLFTMKNERVATGECEHFIQHELQWARWFVEASDVGVLHLKVQGCMCRPDWEEPLDDDFLE